MKICTIILIPWLAPTLLNTILIPPKNSMKVIQKKSFLELFDLSSVENRSEETFFSI